ncbi:uncharacterized protein LOC133928800 [Phragmites australis]|uniref:uncharacterized protein LOC133928800 n=1 Tax=Phragmites australis TaxID=29695 RepID=UPI002D782AC5|nr:uncharacterized protein LOC133928800 [Phragmites australis]
MYAGGENRANGGGGEGGGDTLLQRRSQPGPSSSGAAAAASSSSSARGEEEGGGNKQGRRKKQGKRQAMARAIRSGLPAAASSCWRGVSVVPGTGERRTWRRWSRRERAADGDGGGNAGEDGSGPGETSTATAGPAAAWCCVCPGGDCSLEPNPSANGKEDPRVRSLLERNDFFSTDCNPHADVLPAAAASS